MIIGGFGFGKIIVVILVVYELVRIENNRVVLFCSFLLRVSLNEVVIEMIYLCGEF